ncbi:MAG: hypothetical protein KatS3mg115_0522 [Candidatus Poribacteria bacterium]|nr:MAG: hypothetical protein KatS3mg115_0522 [Candidatus Poribacteria bacterium]
MRNRWAAAALVWGLALGVLIPFASAKVVNRIVAIVNEEVITQGDLDRLIQEQALMLRVAQRLSLEDALRIARADAAARLDDLIATALLEQEARRQEQEDPALQITQIMLDEAIRQFRMENRLLDDRAFREALQQQGYTEASFRREMLKSLRIRELLKREIVPRLNVTDQDVLNFMEADPGRFANKEEAEVALREQRFAEERDRYVQRLRENSFVKVLVDPSALP